MSFVLDTNVLSEIRKGARMNPAVAAWYGSTVAEELFTRNESDLSGLPVSILNPWRYSPA